MNENQSAKARHLVLFTSTGNTPDDVTGMCWSSHSTIPEAMKTGLLKNMKHLSKNGELPKSVREVWVIEPNKTPFRLDPKTVKAMYPDQSWDSPNYWVQGTAIGFHVAPRDGYKWFLELITPVLAWAVIYIVVLSMTSILQLLFFFLNWREPSYLNTYALAALVWLMFGMLVVIKKNVR